MRSQARPRFYRHRHVHCDPLRLVNVMQCDTTACINQRKKQSKGVQMILLQSFALLVIVLQSIVVVDASTPHIISPLLSKVLSSSLPSSSSSSSSSSSDSPNHLLSSLLSSSS